ncbi:MAG: hypothetical protein NVS3B20_24540 [Polyangiales bacterium]
MSAQRQRSTTVMGLYSIRSSLAVCLGLFLSVGVTSTACQSPVDLGVQTPPPDAPPETSDETETAGADEGGPTGDARDDGDASPLDSNLPNDSLAKDGG